MTAVALQRQFLPQSTFLARVQNHR